MRWPIGPACDGSCTTARPLPRLPGAMFMSFSHEDVQRLLQLLDSSHFDELHLEAEGVKLSLRRGGVSAPLASAPLAAQGAAAAATGTTPMAAVASAPVVPPAQAPADTSLLEVRAPMLGTFYGAPKPGAAPFVAAGARVTADSVVGIIEVMKLMNSISAGVDGVVVEVLARDGDLVEFDQVLMRVRPA
jgi:acetyl-CoA carboxylase biotin carboxyl carrier protein